MSRRKQWPRVRSRTRKVKDGVTQDYVIDCGIMEGKRHVECRATLELAEARAAEIRREHDQIGAAAINMTADQRLSAARAFKRLDGAATLDAVLDFWFLNHGKVDHTVTVAEVQAQLLAAQAKKGLRAESIVGTRTRYSGFIEQHGERPISEVSKADVEAWLATRSEDSQTTLGNRIRYLNVFFSYAVKQGFMTLNPMNRIERPRKKYTVPEFLTADEVRKLMSVAENLDPDMAVKLAIGFFSGIRPEELNKLDWQDVKMDGTDNIIKVRPEVAKCGVPRNVEILPNLLAWLMAYRKPMGPIGLKTKAFNMHRRELMDKANVVRWPHDAMRHSFATFHIAAFENAAKTAFELGHTQGVGLLYKHYRGLTTKTEADSFWQIRPGSAQSTGQVVSIATA